MIEDYHFGLIKINGEEFDKDIFIDIDEKIIPWWREKSHLFQKKDIESFLEKRPEIIIFGTGEQGLAKISIDIEDFLKDLKIEIISETTSQAVKTYNGLKEQNKKVIAFLHLTC